MLMTGRAEVDQINIALDVTSTPALRRPNDITGERGKLALVIPTYREAGNLHALLNRVRTALDGAGACYEIVVVDDDSRDGTVEVVSAIAESDPRVRLVVREGERGLSGAVLQGWQCTSAGILGVMDADLQHPPELLPALLEAIQQGNDLVIGSRYVDGGKIGRWNPARHFVSAAAIWATRPLQQGHLRVCDPISGFFLVRRDCLNDIPFQKRGFKLMLEILARGRIQSVREIPFSFGLRHVGQSKANVKVALDYAALLARLYRERFGLEMRSQRAAETGG